MRIRPFEYHTADTLKDALEMMGRYGSDASVLAGGTDLVLAMKHKESHPAHVVSLHKIKDLAFVDAKNGSIRRKRFRTPTAIRVKTRSERRSPEICRCTGYNKIVEAIQSCGASGSE